MAHSTELFPVGIDPFFAEYLQHALISPVARLSQSQAEQVGEFQLRLHTGPEPDRGYRL